MTSLELRTTLVQTMFEVVDQHGLDGLTVREVASRVGVSIGAVQHHFPSKDAMLRAAFDEVVSRTHTRLATMQWGNDVRANVLAALSQLLPLDAARATETRVHLAFAARAAVDPDLAAAQARTLKAVTDELASALAGYDGARRRAATLLATADGLAMHAVSSAVPVNRRALLASLSAVVDALLG